MSCLPGGGGRLVLVCASSRALRVVEAQVGPQEQDYSIIHKIVQKERTLGTVAPTVPTHDWNLERDFCFLIVLRHTMRVICHLTPPSHMLLETPERLERLHRVSCLPGGGGRLVLVCASSRALRVVEAQVGPQEQDYSIIHKIVQKERTLGTVAPTVPTHDWNLERDFCFLIVPSLWQICT
eukprot:COSAG02_NODE_9545_length_2183_cov_95.181862_1_plen_181_part_00